MSDLNTIRAEIKKWERSFKQTMNRPPTVDDIKKDHVIADRYKQYKKLSKASVPSTTNPTVKSTAPPSTPPRTTRPKDPPSFIPSRSRIVQPTAPLNTFNPFSPQKKPKSTDGRKEIDQSVLETHSNPFGKASSRVQTRTRSLSPNSFPLMNQIQPPSSPSFSVFSLNPPRMPANAVSRARKRLRGEPVSPSPNKDKRRRIISPTAIPFPRLNFSVADSDNEQHNNNTDITFVDNSPLKAPFSGKSFSRLFDESATSLDNLPTVSKTQDLSTFCVDNVLGPSIQGAANGTKRAKEVLGKRQLTKLDANDTHLVVNHLPESLATLENGNIFQAQVALNACRSSAKRPFSDDESEPVNVQRTRSPLIPPSPPPTNMSVRGSAKPVQQKGNSKTNKGRKKMKSDEKPDNHDDSDDPEPTATLRIINWKATRPLRAVGDMDDFKLDSDPILGYTRSAALHPSSPISDRQHHGSIEIDLPDKLRSVLALRSSASKAQVSEEDQLVKGLLYGRRVTHYNPNKGGEIWDVGEDDFGSLDENRDRYIDGKDEWECEPVPWEVGEL